MMRFAYSTLGWHGPLRETCHSIAELGFEGIEMFQLLYLVEQGKDIRAMLKEFGLQLCAAYFGSAFVDDDVFPSELADVKATVRAMTGLGAHILILGGGRVRRGREDSDKMTFIRNLNTLGKVAREYDAILAFHPHMWTLISSLAEIKKVMEATDPELVKLTADTAHLAGGGAEPTAFLREYRERIVHVQFKDRKDHEFVELGKGNLPIRESYEVLARQGYRGWVTVELDASEDPKASAKANANYLRTQLGIERLRFHPG